MNILQQKKRESISRKFLHFFYDFICRTLFWIHRKWFHVKSEWQKNFYISTLWTKVYDHSTFQLFLWFMSGNDGEGAARPRLFWEENRAFFFGARLQIIRSVITVIALDLHDDPLNICMHWVTTWTIIRGSNWYKKILKITWNQMGTYKKILNWGILREINFGKLLHPNIVIFAVLEIPKSWFHVKSW